MSPFQIAAKRLGIYENVNSARLIKTYSGSEFMRWTIMQLLSKPQMRKGRSNIICAICWVAWSPLCRGDDLVDLTETAHHSIKVAIELQLCCRPKYLWWAFCRWELQAEAFWSRLAVDGQCWKGHQWISVLHNDDKDGLAERSTCCIWSCSWRNGMWDFAFFILVSLSTCTRLLCCQTWLAESRS